MGVLVGDNEGGGSEGVKSLFGDGGGDGSGDSVNLQSDGVGLLEEEDGEDEDEDEEGGEEPAAFWSKFGFWVESFEVSGFQPYPSDQSDTGLDFCAKWEYYAEVGNP
ncbi:uncharacterized protein FIBRA_09368 [Fibroporia radiculosa]|uniref:Uncharacterized protein n=1 Tax=Fibroporia radiculosa TaxID=599839 RepID=J7SCZ4_9APHY|nr:uncharacterized protein FIBRA_09368 [Fibroporia radiculosa]CCM07048.1 predicted protein [Fibroporia radiculosa]